MAMNPSPGPSEVRRAVVVAVSVFLATFLAGLIERGADVWDPVNPTIGSLAIEALIAAGLAVLGWEIYTHRPGTRPAVAVVEPPPP